MSEFDKFMESISDKSERKKQYRIQYNLVKLW